MKQRITIETLQAGQIRPYADTTRHVRVTFESTLWHNLDGDLFPDFCTEERVRGRLRGLQCGFVEGQPADDFATKLDWLRPVDAKTADQVIPQGDPTQNMASIWEFHTSTRYND